MIILTSCGRSGIAVIASGMNWSEAISAERSGVPVIASGTEWSEAIYIAKHYQEIASVVPPSQ